MKKKKKTKKRSKETKSKSIKESPGTTGTVRMIEEVRSKDGDTVTEKIHLTGKNKDGSTEKAPPVEVADATASKQKDGTLPQAVQQGRTIPQVNALGNQPLEAIPSEDHSTHPPPGTTYADTVKKIKFQFSLNLKPTKCWSHFLFPSQRQKRNA